MEYPGFTISRAQILLALAEQEASHINMLDSKSILPVLGVSSGTCERARAKKTGQQTPLIVLPMFEVDVFYFTKILFSMEQLQEK